MSIIDKYDAIISWINLNRSGFKTQTEVIEAIRKNSRIEGYIRELSLILFQHTLGTCGNCLADAMIAIRKYPRAKLKQIMNCKFKLKSGVLLIDATGRLPEATAANLTDEIAIAYLRDNIKRADMFDELPENLEELLAEEEKIESDGGVSNGSDKPKSEEDKGNEEGKLANADGNHADEEGKGASNNHADEEGKNADGNPAAEENNKDKQKK